MSVAFAGIVNDPLYYGRIKLRPDIYFCTMKISHVGIYAQKLRVGSNLLFQFFWRKIYTWSRNFMRRNIWCGNLPHFLPETEKHWVRCCDTTPASTIRAPWTRDLLTFKEYYGGVYWKASQLVGSIFIFIYLFIFIFLFFCKSSAQANFYVIANCPLLLGATGRPSHRTT